MTATAGSVVDRSASTIQSGQFVFGVEFSGSWADISGSHGALLAPGDTYHSDINTILHADRPRRYDLRPHAALRNGRWRVGARRVRPTTAAGVIHSVKQNRTGWTVGAGIEYGITPNWSIAAQYNYIDLGDKDVNFTGAD